MKQKFERTKIMENSVNTTVANLSLYKKLSLVQNEINVPKTLFNSYGGFSYRSAEGILEAVKPVLAKHNLLLRLEDGIKVLGESVTVTKDSRITRPERYIEASAILVDLDTGEEITTHAYARECEHKGMSADQCTGAASSYARKYCLNALFLLDDNKDSDTGEVAKMNGGNQNDGAKNNNNYNGNQNTNYGGNQNNGYRPQNGTQQAPQNGNQQMYPNSNNGWNKY